MNTLHTANFGCYIIYNKLKSPYLLPTLLHYSVFVRSFVQDSAPREATLLRFGPQKQILLYSQKYT